MANIKYKENGEYKDIVVKVGDTTPIGAIIGFDTTQTIPDGWEYYAENQIKKIAPVTPANGNIENSYGTSQENTYSQEYINGKLKCTRIWQGTAYQLNDTMVLDEPLETGKLYIVKFYGNSGSFYNYDYFIYQNLDNTNLAQINYYSYPDTVGFRYRFEYFPTTKTIKIKDASNGATNRAIKEIYKVN